MTSPSTFEQAIADLLGAEAAGRAPTEVLANALEAVASSGQERYLTQRLLGDRLGRSSSVRLALVIVLFALAATGVAAVAGGLLRQPAPPVLGAFQPGPSLLIGRGFHTTTLLLDGRILVVGGQTHPDSWVPAAESTEVWDPATGDDSAFVRSAPPLEARSHHTATLLPDGRVLIVGGLWWDGTGTEIVRSSAEVWDPGTGTFSPAGRLEAARNMHTATLLPDGRVLVTGGDDVGTAEVWDPRTSTFSPAGELGTLRAGHAAFLLRDGRVMLVGDADTEFWDPTTGAFTQGPSLAEPRYFHTATLLHDGRVLVIGGMWGSNADIVVRSSAEVWDPATNSFVLVDTIGVPRAGHTATLLLDGRVLIVGGDDAANAEIWDPRTGVFTATGPYIQRRTNATATLLPDGRVLVLGAMSRFGIPGQTEIWDPFGRPVESAGLAGPITRTPPPSDPEFTPTMPPQRVGGRMRRSAFG